VGEIPIAWKNSYVTAPAFGSLAYKDAGWMTLSGQPYSSFDVHELPPTGDPVPRGSGTFSWAGIANISLSQPVAANPLRVVDQHGRSSTTYPHDFGPAPELAVLSRLRMGGDRFDVALNGYPGTFIGRQRSHDLDDWTSGRAWLTGPFGDIYYSSPIFEGSKFYRFGEVDAPVKPVGPFHFIIPSGVATELDIGRKRSPYRYELVTPPELHSSLFTWNSDGTFTVTLLGLEAPVTFTYREILTTSFSQPVMVTVEADDSILRKPVPYQGFFGMFVDVWVLPYNGLHYPLYQFALRNAPHDVCVEPHWHAFRIVFPIEDPTTGIPDPNAPACGFGRLLELQPVKYTTTLEAWNEFLALHP
jgi:hypothetical protein